MRVHSHEIIYMHHKKKIALDQKLKVGPLLGQFTGSRFDRWRGEMILMYGNKSQFIVQHDYIYLFSL